MAATGREKNMYKLKILEFHLPFSTTFGLHLLDLLEPLAKAATVQTHSATRQQQHAPEATLFFWYSLFPRFVRGVLYDP